MAEINKNKNSGYLFVNKKKTGKQPDYRGKITIEGKEYSLSAWKGEKDGDEMLSLSATDPATFQNQNAAHQNTQNNQPQDESNKSDPQPENKKSNNVEGFSDPDFFGDIFTIPD